MKIAFYKGRKHLFNRLVSWWTRGPYSHVELVLHRVPDGRYVCASSSVSDGGVRMKIIDLSSGNWDVISVPAHTASAEKWFVDHLGLRYDVLGLFGFVCRRGMQDQSKWFCSEAVAASLGIREPWRFDPNSLYALLASSS